MWTYIVKRLLLMVPTGIGIITVFFVISEMVPGGPLDQVESMIIEQANIGQGGDGAGADAAGAGAQRIKIDPQMRMQIKRKLGLNHNMFHRYMRSLVWCGRDSLISDVELDVGKAQKITFRDERYQVYRDGDGFHLFKNAATVNGKSAAIRFDQTDRQFASVLDDTIRFDPITGAQLDGPASLQPVETELLARNFREADYGSDGGRITVTEVRDELYLKASPWQTLTDWQNWHGMFLLKFPISITQNKKCIELIRARLPISMRLGIISFFLTYSLCLLMGISKAARNGSTYDSVTSVMVLIGYGTPGFVLAVFLLRMFGPGSDAIAHLIPLRGIQSSPEIYDQLTWLGKLWDNIHHLIGPIICLTIGSFAGLTMLTKNSVLEEFHQLYAVAARARGLSKRRVLFKHVLRNSLIPLVTGFPAAFVMMFFAGSLLIEKIFSLDGLGLLSYTALIERDYPLIMSNMFIFTYIGLICKLLSDIGYVIVDPRITFEGSQS
jgi:microcin C transport system permease protein